MTQGVADFHRVLAHVAGPLSCKTFVFHNILLHCYSNQPASLALCERLWRHFPISIAPPVPQAELTLYLCHNNDAEHSLSLIPDDAIIYDELELVTQTHCTFATSLDETIEYQLYAPQAHVNASLLSILYKEHNSAIIQLGPLEGYDSTFLWRYVLLFALTQLLHKHGFVVCHAAALTAPGDEQRGTLVLGYSGSGKTTLSVGCTLQGCGLLGDDLVLLCQHENHLLYAHTLLPEISLRSATLDLWPTLAAFKTLPADQRDKRYCDIEQLRTGAMRYATPIRLLLFPQLVEATALSSSSLLPLSKAATLQKLLAQCISSTPGPRLTRALQAQQQQLFSLLTALAEQAHGYEILIPRGDCQSPQLVCSLLEELEL